MYDYNFQKIKSLFLFSVLILSKNIYSACSTPAGVAGQIQWISGVSKVEWCDGANWIDTSNGTGSGCSPAGAITYITGVLYFCNGTNYISMKGVSAGSCSGTTAGTYTYNSGANKYRFCDGTNWYNMEVGGTPPTGLTLAQTSNHKDFTVNWTAGSGNGGAGGCKLQYLNSGSTWTDITSPASVNCDAAGSGSGTINLPGDGWYGAAWSSVSIRLLRISDTSAMGTLGNVTCSGTGGSPSPTTNIDENCNNNWDDYATPNSSSAPTSNTAGAPYTCPSGTYGGFNIVGTASAQWYNYSTQQYYNDAACANFMGISSWGIKYSTWQVGASGTVPSSPVGCTATQGGYFANMPNANWVGGTCQFQIESWN